MVDCDNLIAAYVKKYKVKSLKLPNKRASKINEGIVLLETIKPCETSKLFDLYDEMDIE